MQNIQSILKSAGLILSSEKIDEPSQTYRDFCLLLAETIQKPKSYLYSHSEKFLSISQYQKITQALKKLAQNQPIEYVRGKAIFMNQEFLVNSSVLIPRVETEILLKESQKILLNLKKNQAKNKKLKVLDLGTGSGIIAIMLGLFAQKNDLNIEIMAIDKSKKALKVAQKNARAHQVNINWQLSDWFEKFEKFEEFERLEKLNQFNQFEIVVSNPPYISEFHQDDNQLKAQNSTGFEPSDALFSDKDGLADIQKIIQNAKKQLTNGGYLLLEHGCNQQQQIETMLKNSNYQNIIKLKDDNHQPRTIIAQFFQ